MDRVTIQWSEAAKVGLSSLPGPARHGLIDAVNSLRESDDPLAEERCLTTALEEFARVGFECYRAIYSVESEPLASGDTIIHITVRSIARLKRRQGDKKDVYRLAQRLMEMGIIESQESCDDEERTP